MRMLHLKLFDPTVLNLRSARIFFTGHKIPLHYLSDTSATYVYMTVSAARTEVVFFCDSLDPCYDPCHVIKHES